ncbi:MAG: hypothetical protein ABI811_01315 [Acidobacteriota bacterium]
MRALLIGFAAIFILGVTAPMQAQNAANDADDFHVYRDAPRLLLNAQRLRLLERERERQSVRWQAFDALISGQAPMPEAGFAWSLYYRVAHSDTAGRNAITWALSDGARDLRQLALVFDWCGPLLTKAEADRLATKIQAGMAQPATTVQGQAARAFAAIALADRLPDAGDSVLRDIARWWRTTVIVNGQPQVARDQLYPLLELLHAIRDNTRVDLRQTAPDYFTTLPLDYIAGHYPAPYPSAENDFRVPVFSGSGEPDVTLAARSRAAGLALVALDTNAVNHQYVQGFVMSDRFIMRGAYGVPYEFLWANPYQPGLAYQTLPLAFHDEITGHVFARTDWEEDAVWIGYFDGVLQMFRDGGIQTLRRGSVIAPIHIGTAVVMVSGDTNTARLRLDSQNLFVLGLAPLTEYGVEIDDQELEYLTTDIGGTLVVKVPEGTDAGVRLRRHGLN